MKTTLTAGLFAVLICSSDVSAQWHGPKAPDSLSFQGRLTDTAGDPVGDGNYSLVFSMYKGSTKVWEQTHASVPVSNGVFSVILSGSVTWPLDTVAFNEPIDLGIKVGADVEMAPRTPLTSAAYALGMRGMYAVWADDGANKAPNLIGGAPNNQVANGVVGATISGGGGWDGPNGVPDSVLGDWGTVSGGRGNVAGDHDATVGGGADNRAADFYSTVGGGSGNRATGGFATIGGGEGNSAAGGWAVTVGGDENSARGDYAVVGGGKNNDANASSSSVLGGVENVANGVGGSIGGGFGNRAQGNYSTVPGGEANRALKSFTFAAGRKAHASHNGSFVWADSTGLDGTKFETTADNQFIVRASGGVGIGTNKPKRGLTISRDVEEPAYQLELRNVGDIHGGNFDGIAFTQTDSGATESASIKVIYHNDGRPDMSFNVRDASNALFIEAGTGDVGLGTASPTYPFEVGTNSGNGNGAHVTAGGVWTNGSSRTFKTNFKNVDAHGVLERLAAVPVMEWEYRNSDEGRHMGPVAEDFFDAFNLGNDNRYIGTIDAAGVSMAAIQGLYELVREQQALITALTTRLDELERR